jgi:hypothetical protein
MAEPGSKEVEEVEEMGAVEVGGIKLEWKIQTDDATSGPLEAHAATEEKTKKQIIQSAEARLRRCLRERKKRKKQQHTSAVSAAATLQTWPQGRPPRKASPAAPRMEPAPLSSGPTPWPNRAARRWRRWRRKSP